MAIVASVSAHPLEYPEEFDHQLVIGGEAQTITYLLRVRRDDRGSVGGDVSRGPDGTRVAADANYNIHTSKDGRTKVDARAEWERVYSRQGHSRPNYNVGVGFRHKFG